MVKTTQVSSLPAFTVLEAAEPHPGDKINCDARAAVALETRRGRIAVSVSITVFSTPTFPRGVKSSGRITVTMLLIDAARSSAAELGLMSTIKSARHRPPVLRNANEPAALTTATAVLVLDRAVDFMDYDAIERILREDLSRCRPRKTDALLASGPA